MFVLNKVLWGYGLSYLEIIDSLMCPLCVSFPVYRTLSLITVVHYVLPVLVINNFKILSFVNDSPFLSMPTSWVTFVVVTYFVSMDSKITTLCYFWSVYPWFSASNSFLCNAFLNSRMRFFASVMINDILEGCYLQN